MTYAFPDKDCFDAGFSNPESINPLDYGFSSCAVPLSPEAPFYNAMAAGRIAVPNPAKIADETGVTGYLVAGVITEVDPAGDDGPPCTHRYKAEDESGVISITSFTRPTHAALTRSDVLPTQAAEVGDLCYLGVTPDTFNIAGTNYSGGVVLIVFEKTDLPEVPAGDKDVYLAHDVDDDVVEWKELSSVEGGGGTPVQFVKAGGDEIITGTGWAVRSMTPCDISGVVTGDPAVDVNIKLNSSSVPVQLTTDQVCPVKQDADDNYVMLERTMVGRFTD